MFFNLTYQDQPTISNNEKYQKPHHHFEFKMLTNSPVPLDQIHGQMHTKATDLEQEL